MKKKGEEIIHITRKDFDEIINQAIERANNKGAQAVLKKIGLADEDAPKDIRTLRDLLASLNLAKRTFLQTLVRWITIGILALILAGVAGKIGLFNK